MNLNTQQPYTESAVKPAPLIRSEGDARLVVSSLGKAGAGMVRILRRILPYSDAQVAALLYQAPSELVVGLPRSTAEAMNQMLRETGLESAVLDARESFSSGQGDHEVALVVHQVEQLPALLQEVVEVLGVDVSMARKLLCASPAIVMGRISQATVEALRQRFSRWGAELDVSQPHNALFDLFVPGGPAVPRNAVLRALQGAGVTLAEGIERTQQPLVAEGLNATTANTVWERLMRTHTSVRLLNRDFQRFEVVLERAAPSPELAAFLSQSAGIPPAVVPKLLGRLPVVTHQNIPHAALGPLLEELTRLGCQVTARLLSLQTFSLEVTEVRDLATTCLTLRALADLEEPQVRPLLRALPARIEGPFTPVHARWLQHELKRAGTLSRLVLR